MTSWNFTISPDLDFCFGLNHSLQPHALWRTIGWSAFGMFWASWHYMARMKKTVFRSTNTNLSNFGLFFHALVEKKINLKSFNENMKTCGNFSNVCIWKLSANICRCVAISYPMATFCWLCFTKCFVKCRYWKRVPMNYKSTQIDTLSLGAGYKYICSLLACFPYSQLLP